MCTGVTLAPGRVEPTLLLSSLLLTQQVIWPAIFLCVPPGFNPDIQFMGHLWEPLKAGHRLLAFYLGTEAIAYCSRRLLRRWGFKHRRHA